jgi:hypothetical protein
MKATLIKEKEGVYSLLDSNRFISTTECKDGTPNKLSLKNCEAIANGYDLDELSTSRLSTRFDENSGYHKFVFVEAYKEGFLKAMEILGDKKFSEKQLKHNMLQLFYLEKNEYEAEAFFRERQLAFIENSIQSLQQTEFDVIVETVGLSYLRDKDDCLILKRI